MSERLRTRRWHFRAMSQAIESWKTVRVRKPTEPTPKRADCGNVRSLCTSYFVPDGASRIVGRGPRSIVSASLRSHEIQSCADQRPSLERGSIGRGISRSGSCHFPIPAPSATRAAFPGPWSLTRS